MNQPVFKTEEKVYCAMNQAFTILSTVTLIVTTWSSIALAETPESKSWPQVTNGFIDLSNWLPEENGPVNLTGEWGFLWKSLVDFKTIASMPISTSQTMTIPGTWTDENQNSSIPAKEPLGFGTYFTRIKMGQGAKI